MKSSTRTRLAIGGIVVLVAAIGAGLFVFTGATEVVWATMIGIPVVVVAGIALYVRGLLTRTKTSEQQYVRKRGSSVAETFQSHIRTFNDLRTTYPKWSPSVDARIESIVSDFQTQGVEFDPDAGTFELTGSVSDADVQEFERLETEITTLQNEIQDSFDSFVRSEIADITRSADQLQEHELISDDFSLSEPPEDESIPALRDTLDSSRDQATEILTTAVETVREMTRGDTRPDDIDFIESELETAEQQTGRNEYYSAADSIVEARDRLRDQFSGSFETEREEMLNLASAVLDSNVDQHVDAEHVDEIEEIKRTISSLDSALEISELTRRRSKLREACLSIIRSMEQDLSEATRTLRGADLPSGYYNEPSIINESVADDMDRIDDMERFTAEFADGAAQLTAALDGATTKASVVDAYDDFAGRIETELQQTGVVSGDDLPVRHAEQFLGLYNRRNPSVEFDPTEGTLRLGDVEQYDLTIEVEYERGGDPRQAVLELDSESYSDTATVETRVAGSVAFTDVPFGTYTLSADPGVDDFEPVEMELSVEDDSTATVEFVERSLRERLCSEFDDDIEDHLSAIDSQVTETFQEQGYVSTDADLPIRDSYAPCLIAMWGEQNGYALTEANGQVIAYDRQEASRELENIVRYNLDSGEELSFDDARENFLSVPLSDDGIRELIAELDTDDPVSTSMTAIKME